MKFVTYCQACGRPLVTDIPARTPCTGRHGWCRSLHYGPVPPLPRTWKPPTITAEDIRYLSAHRISWASPEAS